MTAIPSASALVGAYCGPNTCDASSTANNFKNMEVTEMKLLFLGLKKLKLGILPNQPTVNYD
jgi:hypothetical protein